MAIQPKVSPRRTKGEGSVFYNEKRRLWICQLEFGVDSNGKRIRKSVSGSTKQEAAIKTRKLILEYGEGKFRSDIKSGIPKKTDLCDFILLYLNVYKKPTVSSVTLENYHYSFLHIQREFTGVNIEDLTPLRIQRFLNKLSLTKHNGNFLSKRTIEGVYGVLNQALKMAVKQKIIPVNPIDEGVLMPKTKQTTLKKQKAIPKEICKEVMDVINQSPTYKPIITVLFRTGLRIGEAMALKWRDIDREKMLLHVNKAITSEVEFDENLNPISRKAVVGKGKTAASIRDVTISDELLRVLDEWKDHKNSQDKKSKTAKPKSDDDFIFITKIGGIRRYDCFRSQFTRFLKEKCLEKYGITFHRFRHTFATMLMEQGINPRVVQELLGHRDIATTLGIYTSVSTENMENATNKFNTALNELLNCEKGEPLK